jgi:hypothetical protein
MSVALSKVYSKSEGEVSGGILLNVNAILDLNYN